MKNYRTIKNCRICFSEDLISVLDLGEIYFSDFVTEDQKDRLFKSPLDLILCNGDCKLLQLKHTVPSEDMYREYWYLSGINNTMITELKDIVTSIENFFDLKKDDYVIDIGANDGTLLRQYKKGINTIGFEPALNLQEKNKLGTTYIISDFFNFSEWEKKFTNKTYQSHYCYWYVL